MRFLLLSQPSGLRYSYNFRKKPVEVEAKQIEEGEYVDTLEGRMHGSPGDWKIKGIEDEEWFVKPEIFRKTYEPVDDEAKEAWEKAYGGTKKTAYVYDRRTP